MSRYKRVVGVDVCKERLDIADSTTAIPMAVDYSIDEIKSKIVSKIKDPKNTLVVCEATGGLEYDLVDALHDAQINVCVANPARVRDFAKGHGYFEKSDKIDAPILRLYGQQVKVTLAKPRSLEERNFIALTRRRCQLLQLKSQESNRGRQCPDPQTRQFIAEMLMAINKQLKTVNSELEKCLDQQAMVNPSIDVIRSVPGVGPVMTATLVAELPELGSLSRSKIAKLAGVAPMIKQSGKSEGKRRARGGRGNVRRVL